LEVRCLLTVQTATDLQISPRLTIHHAVAALAIILSLAVFAMMQRFGVPSKIAWGSAILSILVVAIFWSAVTLGSDDEDDEL
jgi:uncharacterized YccA/Bax inhibitor family protein